MIYLIFVSKKMNRHNTWAIGCHIFHTIHDKQFHGAIFIQSCILQACIKLHLNRRIKVNCMQCIHYRSAVFRWGGHSFSSLAYGSGGGDKDSVTIHQYQPTSDSQAQLISLRHHIFPWIATGTPIMNEQYLCQLYGPPIFTDIHTHQNPEHTKNWTAIYNSRKTKKLCVTQGLQEFCFKCKNRHQILMLMMMLLTSGNGNVNSVTSNPSLPYM
jgi:hypothetical protein